ncbi:hypothetical protein QYF36_003676 [Acer negundo]|nr:hypothetical protein QYF36_003676 [Acer negundo]
MLETYNLIRFSAARNVKALTLDFHNPIWTEDGLENHGGVFDFPVFVYSYQGFESLKLFSCKFLASEFRNYTALKELSLGWIQLGPNSVRTLLMYCPLLESFSLKKCWNIHERLDISRTNLRLKNLVVDRCNFLSGLVKIQAPNLRFFKYSGKAARFYFQSRLTYMQEAELDFGQQSEFSGVADLLYDLLDQLFSVRVLMVCSFLLQVIPIGEEPLDLLKTLNDDVPPFELDPEEFWTNNFIVHRCIKTSLKVVELLGFQGTGNEILMLQYLISFGSVLGEVNLYLSEEDDGYGGNSEKYLQIAESMQRDIQRASHRLRIYIY